MSDGLSVIVCSFERYVSLARTLQSLVPHVSLSSGDEIVVVDNSPDDLAASEFLQRYATVPQVRFVRERRTGLSIARNSGLKAARGRYVAYLDDDVIVAPDWCKTMKRTLVGAGPDVAMIGGRVNLAWSTSRPPWIHDEILGYLGYCNYGDAARPLTGDEHIVGCNMAFKKVSLEAVGGFEAALGRAGNGANLLSNEEVEVARKLKNTGKQLYYEPSAIVDHCIDADRLTKAWFRRRVVWQAVSDAVAGGAHLQEKLKEAQHRKMRLNLLWPLLRLANLDFGRFQSAVSFRRELQTIYDRTLCKLVSL